MSEQKIWIEMFTYRYDRPWPSGAPWMIDVSDGFLGLGALAAFALVVMARWPRLGVVKLSVAAVGALGWALYVYMPIAAQHWGMRDEVKRYYDERHLYGAHLVYDGARELAEDWAGRSTWTIPTHVPENLQEGQPVTIRITLKSADDKRVDRELSLGGTVSAIDVDGARVTVSMLAGDLAKLAPIIKQGQDPKAPLGRRWPIRVVDADKLLAWQLYWRGENFWSGDEIWGPVPELHTAYKEIDNVEFLKYLNDRTLCPEGRRYWVITEAGRISNLKTILPTPRAKDTFRVEDMSSNKFTLASFEL